MNTTYTTIYTELHTNTQFDAAEITTLLTEVARYRQATYAPSRALGRIAMLCDYVTDLEETLRRLCQENHIVRQGLEDIFHKLDIMRDNSENKADVKNNA